MNDESFHSRTRGMGWSQYSDEMINTGESSRGLLVRVHKSALILIKIHNEQVRRLVEEIEGLKAAQHGVQPTDEGGVEKTENGTQVEVK